VYERLTAPGKKPSLVTLVITQAVSGLWHGVFAGYALMFISCAFFFHSSKVQTQSNYGRSEIVAPVFSYLLQYISL